MRKSKISAILAAVILMSCVSSLFSVSAASLDDVEEAVIIAEQSRLLPDIDAAQIAVSNLEAGSGRTALEARNRHSPKIG